MGFRLRSIRQRIFLLVLVPVLSVIGLYIFATAVTAGNAISLAHTTTLRNATGEPTGDFLSALDVERPLALVYLSAPTGANLAVLEAQETKTNTAAAGMRAALTGSATRSGESAGEKAAIAALLTDANSLPALRSQMASQIIPKSRAFSEYNGIIDEGYRVLDETILQESNASVVTQSLAFVTLGRSEEMLLREDALVVSDLAARSFPAGDRAQFAQLVGARKVLYSETLPNLDPVYRDLYLKDVSPKASTDLAAMETRVMSDTATSSPPPVDPAAWQQAVEGVSAGFSSAGTQASALITNKASATANSTDLRLGLVGGIGLLAVLLSIFVSVWIGRGLVRELASLRQSALELANERQPSVVRRVAAGEDVDVSAETPDVPAASSDEVGQVRQAFASVQQTAVEAAVGQARLRQGISDIFRNLARRSQSLLHRQLTLLDAMERRAGDPDQLADLFRIDHLTTRMRRHAESLIILSGDAPARGWRNPVPLVDVLRAAVAEVEDYTRIKVSSTTQAALAGPAVGDIIHMIAELAENACIFSPPNTPVLISGDIVGRGFAVEIEDRGLGLSEEKLAEINNRLESPPAFDLSGSDQLGLFVASQLAKRHDIKIALRASPYGGTTAIVLIPVGLVVPEGSYEHDPSAGTVDQQAIQLTGRHAAREDEKDSSVSSPFAPAFGDPVKNGRSAAAPGPTFREDPGSLAYLEEPGSLGFPEEPESLTYPGAPGSLGYPEAPGPLTYADEGGSLAYPEEPRSMTYAEESGSLAYPEEAEDWSPARVSPKPDPVGSDDLIEGELPRRIRQASLAPQLRDSSGHIDTHTDSDSAGARSPEEARATVSAIQQGWQRGRSLFDPSDKGTVTGTAPSADDGKQQNDD
jgi:signal transduction histidine kinase